MRLYMHWCARVALCENSFSSSFSLLCTCFFFSFHFYSHTATHLPRVVCSSAHLQSYNIYAVYMSYSAVLLLFVARSLKTCAAPQHSFGIDTCVQLYIIRVESPRRLRSIRYLYFIYFSSRRLWVRCAIVAYHFSTPNIAQHICPFSRYINVCCARAICSSAWLCLRVYPVYHHKQTLFVFFASIFYCYIFIFSSFPFFVSLFLFFQKL